MKKKKTNGRRVYAEWYARLSPGWRDEEVLFYNGDEVETQPLEEKKADS